MFSKADLAVVKRAYAKQIAFIGGVEHPALEEAFATTPRERFVGEGPWQVFGWSGYRTTPTADPVYLYSDVLIGLVPERGLNNGQPSGHAKWMAAAGPRPGERVVHIGAGVGYYSAILAHLMGPSGRVTAVECDPALASRATANLSAFPSVDVLQGDGTSVNFEPADVIYVNAGATRPMDVWLDRLNNGGRLVLPLTTNRRSGAPPLSPQGGMFRFERRGAEFSAAWISPAAFIPGEGMRDEDSEAALAAAFAKGGWQDVASLHRTDGIADERCWVHAPGWSLVRAVKPAGDVLSTGKTPIASPTPPL